MKELTKGERFIFNWQYRLEDKNSFKGLLARVMAKADSGNLMALSQGFPEEAEAMNNFHTKEGWWERVEDKGRAENPFKIFSKKKHPQNNVATKE